MRDQSDEGLNRNTQLRNEWNTMDFNKLSRLPYKATQHNLVTRKHTMPLVLEDLELSGLASKSNQIGAGFQEFKIGQELVRQFPPIKKKVMREDFFLQRTPSYETG